MDNWYLAKNECQRWLSGRGLSVSLEHWSGSSLHFGNREFPELPGKAAHCKYCIFWLAHELRIAAGTGSVRIQTPAILFHALATFIWSLSNAGPVLKPLELHRAVEMGTRFVYVFKHLAVQSINRQALVSFTMGHGHMMMLSSFDRVFRVGIDLRGVVHPLVDLKGSPMLVERPGVHHVLEPHNEPPWA